MAATMIRIDEERLRKSMEEATLELDRAEGELLLDFSQVRRIDAPGIKALEALVSNASSKSVKIVLQAVSVDVYKVLKLVKLSGRCEFVS